MPNQTPELYFVPKDVLEAILSNLGSQPWAIANPIMTLMQQKIKPVPVKEEIEEKTEE